ncbi:MAG TPA: hypothetical protein PK725_12755 [Rhodocyclaceae bacterium]|nr:hypothetical protein [Rhodocyclaceae bacterium]HRQ47815.1 hypothetical protein [Rhodocyclaceae bacterium]
MGASKNVLMVAHDNKVEALRMATGLTLLDDAVRVIVVDGLPQDEAAQVQIESLEFAEVPIEHVDGSDEGVRALARAIVQADAVFVV